MKAFTAFQDSTANCLCEGGNHAHMITTVDSSYVAIFSIQCREYIIYITTLSSFEHVCMSCSDVQLKMLQTYKFPWIKFSLYYMRPRNT